MSRPVYIPSSSDIIWLELDPRTGHEQSGRRPCLVLSERTYTERTGLAVVCPITSQAKGLPFEILLEATKTAGAVLPIHVRSVDIRARYARFIEQAPTSVTQRTRDFVRVIIGATG